MYCTTYRQFVCKKVDRFTVNETLTSLSIGLSLLSFDARMSSVMLFEQAEKGLYRAKKDGRNCVRIFLKSLDDCSYVSLICV